MMISKILPLCSPIMRLLTTSSSLYFSQSFRADRNLNMEVFKIQNFNNMKDILGYMRHNKQMSDTQFHELCQKTYYLKNISDSQQNYKPLNDKISNINVENCSIDTLAYVCGLIPFTNQNLSQPFQTYMKIFQRVNNILDSKEEAQKLTNDQLIMFFQLCHELQRSDLTLKITKVLAERFHDQKKQFKINSKINLLRWAGKVRFLQYQAKKLISQVAKSLQNEILDRKINYKSMITLYRSLKYVSHSRSFDVNSLVDVIQQKLKTQIDQLQQQQIVSLLNYKNPLNVFHRIILVKILQEINENGESDVDSKLILKVLNKITDGNTNMKVVGEKNQEKILNFLKNNLGQQNQVVNIIKNNLISRQGIIKLVSMIEESEHKDNYAVNSKYLCSLLFRGILNPEIYKKFLEKAQKDNQKLVFSYNFMAYALIVDKLLSKDPQNSQLKQLKQGIIKKITSGFQNQLNQRSLNSKRKDNFNLKINENFYRKYGQHFITKFLNTQQNKVKTEEKKQGQQNNQRQSLYFQTNLFNYLFSVNDYKSIIKFARNSGRKVSRILLRSNLQKILNNPYSYAGSFESINRIITYCLRSAERQDGYIKKYILDYLCNWNIHSLLSPNQVPSFLELANQFLQSNERTYFSLNQFSLYFIKSPNYVIKDHEGYAELIRNIQQISCKITNSEGNTEQQFKYIPMDLLIEALNYNIVNKQFLKKVTNTNKQKSRIRQSMTRVLNFIKVAQGEKFSPEELQIDSSTLPMFLHSNPTNQQIQSNLVKIKLAITNSKTKQLQKSILNLSSRKSKETSTIINSLIEAYNQKITNREVERPNTVLKYLQRMSFNSTQYKQFLVKLSTMYMKNLKQYPIGFHFTLIAECLSNRIQVKEYVDRLVTFLEVKISKYQLQPKAITPFVQTLLTSDTQGSKLLQSFILRMVGQNQFQYRLIHSLPFGDLTNQKFATLAVKVLKNAPQMYESFFRYMVAKNPVFKQLQGKIKLIPIKQLSFFKDSLTKYLDENKIAFEKQQKYGVSLIKVGKTYLAVTNRQYNQYLAEKLKEYNSIIFELPEAEKENIKVLFLNSGINNRIVSHFLSQQFQQLKDHKDKLKQYFYNENKQKRQSENSQQKTTRDQNRSRGNRIPRNNRSPRKAQTQKSQGSQGVRKEKKQAKEQKKE